MSKRERVWAGPFAVKHNFAASQDFFPSVWDDRVVFARPEIVCREGMRAAGPVQIGIGTEDDDEDEHDESGTVE
ncbi:MAG TPA: hypothetical protein VN281_02610 [Verrucomicrobiae bacterium]|nr:hypothetical protein [Verrucomicrobiae bacterium]